MDARLTSDPIEAMRAHLARLQATLTETESRQPRARARKRSDPGRPAARIERLQWEAAPDAMPAEQSLTTKWQARQREAERDINFDPHWQERKCPQCGQVFRVTASNATKKRYCSAACSNAARQAKHRAALRA